MKEQEFDSNSPKIFEASSVPGVQPTTTGTNFLNKSPAHIKEHAKNLGATKILPLTIQIQKSSKKIFLRKTL